MRKSKYLILSGLYFEFETNTTYITLKNTYKDFFRNQNILDLLRFDNIMNIVISIDYYILNFIYLPNQTSHIKNSYNSIFSSIKYNIKYINFSNCNKLKRIDTESFVGNNINIIDLSNCKYLDKIDISAFEQCNIKRIKIPNNIKDLNPYAFYDNNISIIDLSNCKNLADLSSSLFRKNKLKSIKLPPNLKSISNNCFDHNLINYLDLSNYSKLSSISYDVFLENPLEEIKIQYNIIMEYNHIVKNDKWNEFTKYYNETGKRAGDYKLENNQWNWYPL